MPWLKEDAMEVRKYQPPTSVNTVKTIKVVKRDVEGRVEEEVVTTTAPPAQVIDPSFDAWKEKVSTLTEKAAAASTAAAASLPALIKAEVAAEVARSIEAAVAEDLEDDEDDPSTRAARAYSESFKRPEDEDDLEDDEDEYTGELDEETVARLARIIADRDVALKAIAAEIMKTAKVVDAFALVVEELGSVAKAREYIALMRTVEKEHGHLPRSHPFILDDRYRALGFRFPGATEDDDVMASSTGENADRDDEDVNDGTVGSDVPDPETTVGSSLPAPRRTKKSAVIMGPRRWQRKAKAMKTRTRKIGRG
jgi:hypothetical protein